MGAGIALVALQADAHVLLYDVSFERCEAARQYIESQLQRQVQKGRLQINEAQLKLQRLTLITNNSGLADVDVIIEAVPERMTIKQDLWRSLDEICKSETVFATNTSSLSVSVMSTVTKRAEKVVGFHFFNPAPVMPLIEIVRGEETSDETVMQMVALAQQLGKHPTVCRDTPGFIVNRVARNYYGEAMRIVHEGTASKVVVDDIAEQGMAFRMGPFRLMDFIGIDVNYDVTQSVYTAFHGESRYRPHLLQTRLVESGHFGRKSGRGFYQYSKDDATLSGHLSAVGGQLTLSAEADFAQLENLCVVGDTPLAIALQSHLAKCLERSPRDVGLTYTQVLPPHDSTAMRWRADEIEAFLRSHCASAIIVSCGGDINGQRLFLQAVERAVPSDVPILVSLAGPAATEQASWLSHPGRVSGFNLVLPCLTDDTKLQVVEWSRVLQSSNNSRNDGDMRAPRLLQALRFRPVEIRDGAGGVGMRLLCMVLNEAVETLREGVASRDDIDLAMKLGTNYPHGPLQWIDILGIPTVWQTLNALWRELGEDRYRPSALLRQMWFGGLHGGAANGFYSLEEGEQ